MSDSLSKNPFLDKKKVRSLFNSIASFYEIVNKVMSLGLDGGWRNKAVEYAYGLTLDVACGTGELSSRLSCSSRTKKVLATDISEKMIKWGRKNKHFCKDVSFVVSDAENLPFKDEVFDTVSTSFSLRNFEDRLKALNDMMRVIKPGGRFIILDTLKPQMNKILYSLYKFYLMKVIPFLAGILTGDRKSYEYMSKTILNFYTKDDIRKIIESKGFEIEKIEDISFGIVNLIVARKFGDIN
ncbi:demethylmenaquinone methyltransferase / 2-methoxy-6-polyprenyl-1,4-benzoquinol methylase [Candidatus Kryptobacter tengchongensis]|nr:demethylmenaquinone methyltransferase / 2-methoxy-6-polyprenyl-1,4-benzoquinol methylase [Candidatus Kryptobacter tengchongensis]